MLFYLRHQRNLKCLVNKVQHQLPLYGVVGAGLFYFPYSKKAAVELDPINHNAVKGGVSTNNQLDKVKDF